MARLEPRKALAALLTGVLMAFAMPGFGAAPLAFVCLIPLLYAIDAEVHPTLDSNGRARRRFLYGWIAGVAFFALDQRWILTLYRFSPWVVPGFFLAVLFLGLFFAVAALLTAPGASAHRAGWRQAGLLLSVPAAFALLEIARAQGPLGTGFSMLYTSLYRVPAMIQLASWFGSWAITALIAMANAALYLALRNRRIGYLFVAAGTLLALLAPALLPAEEGGEPIRVAVVSSNVAQEFKLDGRNLPVLADRYMALGAEAASRNVDLIVFPESILPSFILTDQENFKRIQELARSGSTRILFGTGVYEHPEIRNEVALLASTGELVDTYAMVRPVPFGETIPGRRIWAAIGLEGLMNSFLPVDLTAGTSYAPVGGIGTPICFESTFPDAARASTAQGAEFLAVVTNDAWFVGSSELHAHFASAVFRAVEAGRDLIQAANGGVSGLIDSRGRVQAETKNEQVTVGEVRPRTHRTLYVLAGDWPLIGLLALMLALGRWIRRTRRSQKTNGG